MGQTSFEPDFKLDARIDETGDVLIALRGELDSGTCEELVTVFRSSLGEGASTTITLDLSEVSFIDSAGIRSVIMIEREARDRGVSLAITAPPNEVTELLRTAGVIEHFQLRPGARRSAIAPAPPLERVELELPRDPQSPARARAEVRELLVGRDRTQVGDVVLLASEILTNAVVHPKTTSEAPIGLRIFTYEEGIRVEVDDAGEGFDPTAPMRHAEERGRGLFLVDRFASQWGTEHVEDHRGRRFMVWFELDWRQPRELDAVGE